jgi:hypothetical protein
MRRRATRRGGRTRCRSRPRVVGRGSRARQTTLQTLPGTPRKPPLVPHRAHGGPVQPWQKKARQHGQQHAGRTQSLVRHRTQTGVVRREVPDACDRRAAGRHRPPVQTGGSGSLQPAIPQGRWRESAKLAAASPRDLDVPMGCSAASRYARGDAPAERHPKCYSDCRAARCSPRNQL